MPEMSDQQSAMSHSDAQKKSCARKLYGKPVAQELLSDVAARVRRLSADGVTPCLAIVSAGEDGASSTYEHSLIRRSDALGIATRQIKIPHAATQQQAEQTIARVNSDPTISGCLILRPLDASLNEDALCDVLESKKDVDGISSASLASVFSGRGFGLPPCTAEACVRVLDYYGVDVRGKHVVVVGRSLTVGRPLSMMLLARNATVTICHSKTKNPEELCRHADVVVCATGRAKAFGKAFFSPGQTILDVGINFDDAGKLCGDVNAAEIEDIPCAYTPVPGGIGAVTTAVTMEHVVRLAEYQREHYRKSEKKQADE